MSAPPPSHVVAQLCDRAARAIQSPALREAVQETRTRLSEPLRVAVAGRVKSGKSTLVNALLHETIAPTAYGECTQAVTWFRHGFPPEARVLLRDGSVSGLAMPGGELAPDIGIDPARVDHLEVTVANDVLREYSIIDTPGLTSSREELSDGTLRALSERSERGTSLADALIFVFNGAIREDEVAVLDGFRAQVAGLRSSALNTVAVLNHADKLGELGEDPLDAARRLRDLWSGTLGMRAAAVVPTIGLVAETAEAGRLTESDAAALRQLRALEPKEVRRLTRNAELFIEREAPVSPGDRRRLLERLGLYGVTRCLGWLEEDGTLGAGALRTKLTEISGIGELRRIIRDVFARRAETIKAAQALERLEQLAYDRSVEAADADRTWLAGEVERERLAPAMQTLGAVWALSLVSAGGMSLQPDLAEDLRRVALGVTLEEKLGVEPGTDAEALRRTAAERSAAWQRWGMLGAGNREQRVVLAVRRQYDALYHLAGSGSAA